VEDDHPSRWNKQFISTPNITIEIELEYKNQIDSMQRQKEIKLKKITTQSLAYVRSLWISADSNKGSGNEDHRQCLRRIVMDQRRRD